MNYFAVAFGLVVANYLCIPLLEITPEQAFERSFFQVVAIIAVWVNS